MLLQTLSYFLRRQCNHYSRELSACCICGICLCISCYTLVYYFLLSIKYLQPFLVSRYSSLFTYIKSSLINDHYSNYSVENILYDKKIINDLNESKSDLINVISLSLKNDISIPCFNDALNYFNSISNNSLSTNMIQAQRNFFGSHTIKFK